MSYEFKVLSNRLSNYSGIEKMIANFKAIVTMDIKKASSEINIFEYALKELDDLGAATVKLNEEKLYEASKILDDAIKGILIPVGINGIKLSRVNKAIDKLKRTVYKINVMDELRFATESEITDGVRGLIANVSYPHTEEMYRQMCLLSWTLCAKYMPYKSAGFDVTFSKDSKKPVETACEMLINCKELLYETINMVAEADELKELIKKLINNETQFRPSKYAKNMVVEEISAKQIVYDLDKIVKFAKMTDEDKKIAFRAIYNNKSGTVTPVEISQAREVHAKYTVDSNVISETESEKEALKSKIAFIDKALANKHIFRDHFVFKIISTMKKIDYVKCSEAQMKVIDSAIEYINKQTGNVNSNKNKAVENKQAESEEETINKEDKAESVEYMLFGEESYDINSIF